MVTRKSIDACLVCCAAARANAKLVATVPQIIIKTGFILPDGREEVLAEYMCDVLGCPNVAAHVLGHAREIHAVHAVCDTHAPGSHLKNT
jgi:hypothetical protein